MHRFCVISSIDDAIITFDAHFSFEPIGDVSPCCLLKGRRKSEEEVQVAVFPIWKKSEMTSDDIPAKEYC